MAKFRIIEVRRLDDKKTWYVQQWRWLLWPHWSSTFFWSHGGANYGQHCTSLAEAETVLANYQRDDREKMMRRFWNKTTTVVKEA